MERRPLLSTACRLSWISLLETTRRAFPDLSREAETAELIAAKDGARQCRRGGHRHVGDRMCPPGGYVMIIVRSPLRITLGGGGTDLPSYYRDHGGFLISAAIDKYVYVTVMRPFVEGIFLKYSKLEKVDEIDEVRHPIIREALQMLGFETPQVEITTL